MVWRIISFDHTRSLTSKINLENARNAVHTNTQIGGPNRLWNISYRQFRSLHISCICSRLCRQISLSNKTTIFDTNTLKNSISNRIFYYRVQFRTAFQLKGQIITLSVPSNVDLANRLANKRKQNSCTEDKSLFRTIMKLRRSYSFKWQHITIPISLVYTHVGKGAIITDDTFQKYWTDVLPSLQPKVPPLWGLKLFIWLHKRSFLFFTQGIGVGQGWSRKLKAAISCLSIKVIFNCTFHL